MHKVTVKRQITLPQSVCEAMDLTPGDYVEIFEYNGVAQVVKMTNKSLAGAFSHLVKKDVVKEQELPDSFKDAIKARAAKKFKGEL